MVANTLRRRLVGPEVADETTLPDNQWRPTAGVTRSYFRLHHDHSHAIRGLGSTTGRTAPLPSRAYAQQWNRPPGRVLRTTASNPDRGCLRWCSTPMQ